MARVAAAAGVVAGLCVPGAVPARAAGPDCVALVVDPAPGAARTSCVTWTAGLTGLAVLRAGHSVVFRPTDGLICQIDRTPATCTADATHYWSYWHRPAGGSAWAYSNQGASTYQPPRNSTDGWAYQNGSGRQPANIAFRTICPQAAATTTRASTRPPAPPPAPPARTTGRPPAPPARPGSTAPRSGGTTAAPPPPSGSARAPATGPAPTGTSPPGTATPAPPGPAPSSAAAVPVAAPDGGGAPVGALVGIVLAAAVAGAGIWFARARRAGQG